MPSVAHRWHRLADGSSRRAPIDGVRFLFLNQYFPPDPAPTGILFRELADHLGAHGHKVDFVASQQKYRAGQQRGGRLAREVAALVDFIRTSKRGVILRRPTRRAEELVAEE